MIYIEKIEFVGNSFRGKDLFDKNFQINCKEVNLLVGDQGCGKSTLLQLMNKNHPDVKLTLSDFTIEKGVDSFFFDTEKDNPRVKNPLDYTKPNGESTGIGPGIAAFSRFQSHGEVLQHFVITPLLKAKDCVIFLDEPESGLSITNQLKLIKAIKKAAKKNCQLFVATHCYPLIREFDVISLEHKKQMSGKNFISLLEKNT